VRCPLRKTTDTEEILAIKLRSANCKPSFEEKLRMIQRRLRVLKWLSTIPAVGVCTLCSREFKVSMTALRRVADAQASLQKQFDGHKCESDDSSQAAAR
jgi:hypothetical protein